MVGLVGGGEERWVPGSGMHRKVVPLRAPTWGKPGTRKLPRVNARASLLVLTSPSGICARSRTRPNTPNDETYHLPRRAVALGAHGQRAMAAARARR